ncbi:MAG TPA: PilT/PilU family type 4a pilus ATPase [Gemmatimonadaceae bacterium]|nr:PilT/PilU family type 4a pilus ATPase [Gemmatimonadaceae bacterium]
MAQLDKFLAAILTHQARSLRVEADAPAVLDVAGAPRALTRGPITNDQVLALLREVADMSQRAAIEASVPVTIMRGTPDGTFIVRAAATNGRWQLEAVAHGGPSASPSALPASPMTAGASMPASGAAAPVSAPADAPSPGAAPPVMAPATAASIPAARAVAVAPAVSAPASEGGDALDAINEFHGSAEARAALDDLLRLTVKQGASDLHLRVGEPPILRQSGEMVRLGDFGVLDPERLGAMVRAIMPERNRREYAETNDTDYAYELTGVARFRANAARDRMGPLAVFRQIPATVVSVEDMNITEEVQRLCFLTKGLVLVTGPTGSGKSTTLCALVDLVNRARTDHVLTIEDPIEFVHKNKRCVITQRQVGVHTKSFKSALRAALREDPDIILVGEMRDLETVSIAIETAETGHLVFGTLHTTTAAGTIDRIIDQFPADRQEQIRVMLAESLKGVISQTLCKKIGGGRVAAREILLSIPSVTNLIREAKTFQIPSVMQTSKRLGMVTLNDALIAHVDDGIVDPKEAYMKAVDKTGFSAMLKQRGLDVSFAESDPGKK